MLTRRKRNKEEFSLIFVDLEKFYQVSWSTWCWWRFVGLPQQQYCLLAVSGDFTLIRSKVKSKQIQLFDGLSIDKIWIKKSEEEFNPIILITQAIKSIQNRRIVSGVKDFHNIKLSWVESYTTLSWISSFESKLCKIDHWKIFFLFKLILMMSPYSISIIISEHHKLLYIILSPFSTRLINKYWLLCAHPTQLSSYTHK